MGRKKEFHFDEENCITLCEDCHKDIHSADKHTYGEKKNA